MTRRLVILDDIFPVQLSAFRIAEYNVILDAFPDALVYSTASSFPLAGETRDLDAVIAEYERDFPRFAGRVHRFDPAIDLTGTAAYMIFINNAATFLPVLTRDQVPFALTLYPGGGLQLFDAASDAKLTAVLGSPLCRRVNTTQIVTEHYVAGRFGPPEQTHFVYGGVLPSDRLVTGLPRRQNGRALCYDRHGSCLGRISDVLRRGKRKGTRHGGA